MMDIRCEHALHGRLTDDGLLEVACRSRWCGVKAGVVVLHRFKPETGELVETLKFKAPTKPTNTGRRA